MGRPRSLKTEKDYRRALKAGYGVGEKESYKPWLRIEDVPSEGNRSKIRGRKVDRTHHLMSLLELQLFHILEFHDSVVDIREQFPILPLEYSLRVAEHIGVKHPLHPVSRYPVVLTTDFLVTIKTAESEKLLAVSVKPADKMSDRRTLEKQELERACWKLRNIEFKIFTSNDLTLNQSENIEWASSPFRDESSAPLVFSEQQIISALNELRPGRRLICDICDTYTDLGIVEKDESLLILRFLITKKLIRVDMSYLFVESGIIDILEVAQYGSFDYQLLGS